MSKETAVADLRQLTLALAESSDLPWQECAPVVAQIEGEFGGMAREILEEAAEITDRIKNKAGILETLTWVILNRRVTGKPYDVQKTFPLTENPGAQ